MKYEMVVIQKKLIGGYGMEKMMSLETIRKKFGVSTFILKLIAIISMTIDHSGAVLFPENMWLRIIGRLAFPIFCFMLVEGYYHTKNVRKYILRLCIFALVSEVFFDLAFYDRLVYMGHQNVFFTLAIGLILVALLETNKGNIHKKAKVLLDIGVTFISLLLAALLYTDYSFVGVLTILCFYYFRQNSLTKVLSIIGINSLLMTGIQSFASFSLIPIFLYNGKRGPRMKYIFYVFYPAHLLLLVLISKYGI